MKKKMIVTLFKFMHGIAIPLVIDKVAIGKPIIHDILKQLYLSICNNFGHLIAWPIGQKISWVTSVFMAKHRFPNCIGAIYEFYIYINSLPNIIVTADHHNRYKSFSIVLQGIMDNNC